jgi:AraC-like DNA-binding protein
MTKNGQPPIAALPDRSVGVLPGVEVIDFRRLVARATGHGVDPYDLQRPEFHKLIAVRSGTLRCSLDFTSHELGPGRWLWVRPGQVHRYDSDLAGAEGRIVVFLPGVLDRATAQIGSVDRGPAGAATDALWPVLDLLAGACAEPSSPLQIELRRHLVAVLVLSLSVAHGVTLEPTEGEAFARFQAAVEQSFTHAHRVADYATQLGYSVRTLTRASQAAVGVGAKRFIDDRILLEAKRLLIHTDLTAASIGQRLGFPRATAFTKFFREHTDQTPIEFRIS